MLTAPVGLSEVAVLHCCCAASILSVGRSGLGNLVVLRVKFSSSLMWLVPLRATWEQIKISPLLFDPGSFPGRKVIAPAIMCRCLGGPTADRVCRRRRRRGHATW